MINTKLYTELYIDSVNKNRLFTFRYIGEMAERLLSLTKDIKDINVHLYTCCFYSLGGDKEDHNLQRNQKEILINSVKDLNMNTATKILLNEFIIINDMKESVLEYSTDNICFRDCCTLMNMLYSLYKESCDDEYRERIRSIILKLGIRAQKDGIHPCNYEESYLDIANSIEMISFVFDDLNPKAKETNSQFKDYMKNIRNISTREWKYTKYASLNINYNDAITINALCISDINVFNLKTLPISANGICRSYMEYLYSIIEVDYDHVAKSLKDKMRDSRYHIEKYKEMYAEVEKIKNNIHKVKDIDVFKFITDCLLYLGMDYVNDIISDSNCMDIYNSDIYKTMKNSEQLQQMYHLTIEYVVLRCISTYENITENIANDFEAIIDKCYNEKEYEKGYKNYIKYKVNNDKDFCLNCHKNSTAHKNKILFLETVYKSLYDAGRYKDFMLSFKENGVSINGCNYMFVDSINNSSDKKELLSIYLEALEDINILDYLEFIIININRNEDYQKTFNVDIKEIYNYSDDDVSKINNKISDIIYSHNLTSIKSTFLIHLSRFNDDIPEEGLDKIWNTCMKMSSYNNGIKDIVKENLMCNLHFKSKLKDNTDKFNISSIEDNYDIERYAKKMPLDLSIENKDLLLEKIKTCTRYKSNVAEAYFEFLMILDGHNNEFLDEILAVYKKLYKRNDE